MSRRRIALSSLLAVTIAGCAPGEETAEEEEAAIQQYAAASADVRGAYEAFVRSWLAAFNARDADRLLSLYAADAIRMPPDAPAERGPEAIRSSFEETFRRFSEFRAEGASQQVHFTGDWAIERGTYTFTGTPAGEEGPLTERGKYVVVARRGAEGAWKILWQIWSPNAPEPEPTGLDGSQP